MMRRMYDNHHILFSDKSDNETLHEYVYKGDYVLVRDRPAINHLIFNDFIARKKITPDDERKQCPFATAKEPFIKRRRSFAYQLDSELNLLFDAEYVSADFAKKKKLVLEVHSGFSFNSRLLHLVETGIVKYMLGENLTSASICPLNLGAKERQLRNSDLRMTYFMMFTGYGVAGIVLFSEVISSLIQVI